MFREEYGRILAALIRRTGDFELAEEALQDALGLALERWPSEGTPSRPGAWITTVARRRAIDHGRRSPHSLETSLETLEHDAVAESDTTGADEPHDERLSLIFTCCHPALNHEAQVALTLNTLCGLQTTEIARAFLVRDRTMAQRLVRAKRKIREARIPYRVPPPELFAERLPAVLSVVYLVFNEGYAATEGDGLMRGALCSEAIRLARVLGELLPGEAKVDGLLALMLLQDSRRDARVSADGELLLLDEQDRSLWDHDAIAEGVALVERALRRGVVDSYQVQAAIAAVHAEATRPQETDWAQIVLLYDTLLGLAPSPVVELNRAAAVAMAQGPEAGLLLVERLRRAGHLSEYSYLHAARADLLRRLGRADAATRAYRRALTLTRNSLERRFLERRLEELGSV